MIVRVRHSRHITIEAVQPHQGQRTLHVLDPDAKLHDFDGS